VEGGRRYYVLTETFQRELCAGFDLRNVVRVLKAAGVLEPGGDGKSTRKERLPGIGPARCYVLTPRVWEGEE
jgi:putative DNA primase/helicase